MSGGHFDYKQYAISEIADSIERELEKQGKEIPEHLLWGYEDKFYPKYPTEIEQAMKDAVTALKVASIYAHRVDWFLSDDDGEESFLLRLKEELDALKK